MSDALHRQNATTVTEHNIVVEAGAGTGKTTLLITRLCYLLLVKNISVERIVALTFTEKAAAEIKTRLLKQLEKIVAESAKESTQDRITNLILEHVSKDDILQRAEQIITRLDRSFISTIHSFCSYILKAYPIEAGISPAVAVDEGQRSVQIFKKAWHKFLELELGLNAPHSEEWKEILEHVSLQDIYDYAFTLCSGKVTDYHPFDHADLISQVAFENAEIAQQMCTALLPQGKKPRKVERALAAAAALLQEEGFAFKEADFTKVENEEIEPLKAADQAVGWDDENFETARQIVSLAVNLHPAKQKILLKTYDLIKDFVKEVRDAVAKQGLISFDDILVKTRDLLKNNFVVRGYLKSQFDIIFIDEFQDTDPVQGELLLFLAEDLESTAGVWQDIILAPGKLFIVGDPKQSIYRFRGADITAYHIFTDLILKQGGEKYFLRTNFRSVAPIIDVVNHTGKGIIKEKTGFQPEYVSILSREDAPVIANPVELAIIKSDEKTAADDYRHNQAEYAAQWIVENVGKLKLSDGKILDYKDIAVLMRTSSSVNIFTDAFKRYGIKYSVEEDKNFYNAQEITDILTLLTLINNPQDKIALAGVLRSPLGGLTDNEMYQVFKNKADDIYTKTFSKGLERLEGLYKQLQALRAMAGRKSLSDIINTIYNETYFCELAAKAYNGEQTLSNLKKFARLAAGEAGGAPLGLGQFLENAKEVEKESKGEGESPLADEFLSAVSIMTIHKSKGLEFPVVLFADVFRMENAKGNSYAYSWFHDMHGLKLGSITDPNLAFLGVQQLWHSKAEEARVFYVALTRAKDKLILLGNDEETKKTSARHLSHCGLWPKKGEECDFINMPGFTSPVKVNYVKYLPPADFIYKETVDGAEVDKNVHEPELWAKKWEERVRKYEEIKEAKFFISPSSAAADEPFKTTSAVQASALLLGTLLHKVMENSDFKTPLTVQDITTAAAQTGEEISAEIITEAQQICEAFSKSSAFTQLGSLKTLAREMPFTYYDNGKIVNGITDIVAADGADILVLDYKSDKVKNINKYAAQLAFYKTALGKIFEGKNIKCGIVFIRSGEIEYI
ncbi:ATP-dependent helicase/nuclease subunit A [Elusimicrobium posterum]|uniref:UvrD-helicase domain-containing protein n=1 Tax=Elusimicrobium posterum TaxID=3116653 RepID=UPI003C740F8A